MQTPGSWADRLATDLLPTEYDTTDARVTLLNHRTARVDHQSGTWVARLGGGAHAVANALLYLDAGGFDAARVVSSRSGAAVTFLDGEPIVVTTYVAGETPSLAPRDLRLIGAALGRLHALGVVEKVESGAISQAEMLPDSEIGSASDLKAIANLVPADLRDDYGAIVVACENLDRFNDGPRVLIHGDAHPWNTVIGPDQATYVDWDSSGWGPAIIDLGFLLLSVDRGPLTDPPIPSDPLRVEAVVDGYLSEHLPTREDLGRLADAVRFRPLVFASGLFVEDIRASRSPQANYGWWERCLAAEDIAGRARRRFETVAATDT